MEQTRSGRVLCPLVLALAVTVAGCGQTAPRVSSTHSSASRSAVAAVSSPGCTQAVARERTLRRFGLAFIMMPGHPFGVVAAPGGWTFVALDGVRAGAGGPGGSAVAVVSDAGTSPRIVHLVGLTQDVEGLTLTADGRYVLAATDTGAVVISAAGAERGVTRSVLGALSVPGNAGVGGVEAAVSPDGRFAFVSMEGSARIAVFDLAAALADGFRTSGFVGSVPVGQEPVGLAVSPDGRWLYATSEYATVVGMASGGNGTLSVINLRRAETDPARAVLVTVSAGCGPVRVAVSPDGRIVWVTARGSNAVLGFSSSQLRGAPGRALVADVRVGQSPVGLAIIAAGRAIAVADSARFDPRHAGAALSFVDTAAALSGGPALLGAVRAGAFPRDEALEPGGTTLLVTNNSSSQLEAVKTTGLP